MSEEIRQLIWDRAKKYYPAKASHGLNHIIDNINNAKRMLEFAKEPFTDQIYAAIAFHDSGIEKYGRDKHELYGAEIAKQELKDLFNTKDLFLICEAIKEHRASFTGKFTSTISDICSSADRNTPNFEKAVARSFLYISEHHPEYSFNEKCDVVASHLKEKYGSNGYARLPDYYSKYYSSQLREFKRKIDLLTGDGVKRIVGSHGEKASKIYDVANESMANNVKKITFPIEEHETLKNQDKIVTTRVSADYDKFFVGDLVETPWNVIFKVVKRQEIKDITNHPFYSELTREQIDFLSKYNKIAVLTLEKVDGKNTYYRITYSGVGIYEALKKHSSKEDWDAFLKSDAAKWLPKPTCEYKSYYESYFTELGYKTFMDKTKRFMDKVLDKEKIKVSKYVGIDLTRCVYKDKYQVVVDQNTGRISTESLSDEKDSSELVLDKVISPSDNDLKIILECTNLAAEASGDNPWTMDELKSRIKLKPNIFFIKQGEETVGFVLLGLAGRNAEIRDFAILKKFQGKGLGEKALKAIIDYLGKHRPGKDIELGVAEKNTKAVNLYKKLGFKVIKKGTEDGKVFYRMLLKSDTNVSEEALSDKVASNIENNKVYHASPVKFDVIKGKASKTEDAKSSVFVSPFKHFASMFIFDFQGIVDTIEEQIGKKHIKIDNFGFEEWNETPRSTTSIPSKVHVLVRTPESFKSFKGKATGYLYTIDFSKYKDKADMWSHAQGSDVELIIHGDVHYEECEQITLEYEVMKDTLKNYYTSEEFKIRFTELNVEEISMEEGIELLSEFNEGCKAFEQWVNHLEASCIYKTVNDKGVKQVCYSIAQENILNDTVKVIFQKVGEFIRWFWNKLVQLWKFFFGKVQRAQRAFKSNWDKIKAHKNSNKFFNDKAFESMKAPYGLCDAVAFANFLQDYWDPDKCYSCFETLFNNYENDIDKLAEQVQDASPSGIMNTLTGAIGYGIAGKNITGRETAIGKLIETFPANGTFKEANYERDAVLMLSEMVEHIIVSYAKTSKLIDSKGNIGVSASKRILDYADRADLTEQEASAMAQKVNLVASVIRLAVEKYNNSYATILDCTVKAQECYLKCMQ